VPAALPSGVEAHGPEAASLAWLSVSFGQSKIALHSTGQCLVLWIFIFQFIFEPLFLQGSAERKNHIPHSQVSLLRPSRHCRRAQRGGNIIEENPGITSPELYQTYLQRCEINK